MSDVCGARGSKPVMTGLSASTLRPRARNCWIMPRAMKVLPMSVPVAVMKTAVMPLAATRVRTRSASRAMSRVVVARGEGEAQPRGAGRHRGRADRHHQEALRFEKARRGERRLGCADDQRHDLALRRRQAGAGGEGARLGERRSGERGIGGDEIERRDGRGDDRRAAGRWNR